MTLSQKSLIGLAQEEAKDIRGNAWQAVLDSSLRKQGKEPRDLVALKLLLRGEPWRWQLAVDLRQAGASYGWIDRALNYASENSLGFKMYTYCSITTYSPTVWPAPKPP